MRHLRGIRKGDGEELGWDFYHRKEDPLWDTDEVKGILKRRVRRDAAAEREARRANNHRWYLKNKAKRQAVRQLLEKGEINEDEANRRLAEINVGWFKTRDRVKALEKDLEAARASGDQDRTDEVQEQMLDEMGHMQKMLDLLDSSFKLLYLLYGDPDEVEGFKLPTNSQPEDLIDFLPLALPQHFWSQLDENFLNPTIIREAKRRLHPDNDGDLNPVADQNHISALFNSAVEETTEWAKTASPTDIQKLRDRLYNRKMAVQNAFLPRDESKSTAYTFRSILAHAAKFNQAGS